MPHELADCRISPNVSSTTPPATSTTASTTGMPADNPTTRQPGISTYAAVLILRMLPGNVSEPAVARTWNRTTISVLSTSSTLTTASGAVVRSTIHSGTTTMMSEPCSDRIELSAVVVRNGTLRSAVIARVVPGSLTARTSGSLRTTSASAYTMTASPSGSA